MSLWALVYADPGSSMVVVDNSEECTLLERWPARNSRWVRAKILRIGKLSSSHGHETQRLCLCSTCCSMPDVGHCRLGGWCQSHDVVHGLHKYCRTPFAGSAAPQILSSLQSLQSQTTSLLRVRVLCVVVHPVDIRKSRGNACLGPHLR